MSDTLTVVLANYGLPADSWFGDSGLIHDIVEYTRGLESRLAEVERLPTDGFYLQDSRTFVGNDMLWWGKNGNGYTTDLRKAHVFSAEEAAKGVTRYTDKYWPIEYINNLSRPTVDMQYAKQKDANLKAAIDAAIGKSKGSGE